VTTQPSCVAYFRQPRSPASASGAEARPAISLHPPIIVFIRYPACYLKAGAATGHNRGAHYDKEPRRESRRCGFPRAPRRRGSGIGAQVRQHACPGAQYLVAIRLLLHSIRGFCIEGHRGHKWHVEWMRVTRIPLTSGYARSGCSCELSFQRHSHLRQADLNQLELSAATRLLNPARLVL
jgi:hypothetical protein